MEAQPRRFKRDLPVELTDDELKKKGKKAGHLKKKIGKIKAEMKLAVAGHKEQLKESQAALDTILDDLDAGTEDRKVECEERLDYKTHRAMIVRVDTMEEVETRTMSAEEHQTSLVPDSVGGDDGGEAEDEEVAAIAEKPPRKRGRPRKEV